MEAKRDLAVSLEKLGDLAVQQGKLEQRNSHTMNHSTLGGVWLRPIRATASGSVI